MSDWQGKTPPPLMEDTVAKVIDQVVKIELSRQGTGSGVYVAERLVLTCLHVVTGSPGVYVRFRAGERIEADVVAANSDADLALLRLRTAPASLPADVLGGIRLEMDDYEPGEPLAAIGHPLGLDWAVTGGHFNAIRQPGDEALARLGITLQTPLVQVDVAINPGNSGGPLIDLDGHLVGIADSVINPALANNIGFAVAGSTAITFLNDHRSDETALAAYDCGHHHPADATYCPDTGRPLTALDPVPMPSTDSIPYSCGHYHAPGLAYCPDTGKPITATAEPPGPVGAEREDAPTPDDTNAPAQTCSNCGSDVPGGARACPACGKPQ